LKPERGRSGAIDISRTDGPLSYTLTLFASRVVDPIDVDRAGGLVLGTAAGPNTNTGIDVVTTVRHAPFAVTTTYTYVRSREYDGASRVDSPLTPRHSAGLVGMWEREDAGRVGIEWYYTGVQPLEDNPFRARSRPYMILGALAEKPFGKMRLFINGENLTGARQTRHDPLIRPFRAADGRWTVDAWAPLEGRNVNGGVRFAF
jgi:iron complex outermembrane receptor protein